MGYKTNNGAYEKNIRYIYVFLFLFLFFGNKALGICLNYYFSIYIIVFGYA